MSTKPKLKPCPFCGNKSIFLPTAIPHKVHCYNCECYGPWYDRTGRKWNSIPRRSEVMELLRLVHEVTGWENDLIDTNEFSEDGEAMINNIGNLREYADKLR